MFNHIGGKIMVLAKVLCWMGIVGSCPAAIGITIFVCITVVQVGKAKDTDIGVQILDCALMVLFGMRIIWLSAVWIFMLKRPMVSTVPATPPTSM